MTRLFGPDGHLPLKICRFVQEFWNRAVDLNLYRQHPTPNLNEPVTPGRSLWPPGKILAVDSGQKMSLPIHADHSLESPFAIKFVQDSKHLRLVFNGFMPQEVACPAPARFLGFPKSFNSDGRTGGIRLERWRHQDQ